MTSSKAAQSAVHQAETLLARAIEGALNLGKYKKVDDLIKNLDPETAVSFLNKAKHTSQDPADRDVVPTILTSPRLNPQDKKLISAEGVLYQALAHGQIEAIKALLNSGFKPKPSYKVTYRGKKYTVSALALVVVEFAHTRSVMHDEDTSRYADANPNTAEQIVSLLKSKGLYGQPDDQRFILAVDSGAYKNSAAHQLMPRTDPTAARREQKVKN